MTKHSKIEHTKKWVAEYIIAHQFCPFAKKSWDHEQIRYIHVENQSIENAVLKESKYLQQTADKGLNCLLILEGLEAFTDFWNVVQDMQDLIEDHDLEEAIMIASFHPEYHFQGEPLAYGYTNRSPYPTMHLIQHEEITKSLNAFPEAADWPQRNIKYLEKQSVSVFKTKLDEIRRS